MSSHRPTQPPTQPASQPASQRSCRAQPAVQPSCRPATKAKPSEPAAPSRAADGAARLGVEDLAVEAEEPRGPPQLLRRQRLVEALEGHVREALDPRRRVRGRGLHAVGPEAPVGALQRRDDRAGRVGRQQRLQDVLLPDGLAAQVELLALHGDLQPLRDLPAHVPPGPLRADPKVAKLPGAAVDAQRHGAHLAKLLGHVQDQAAQRLGVLLLVPPGVPQERGELVEIQRAAAADVVEVEDEERADVARERVEDVRRRGVGGRAAHEEVVEAQLLGPLAVHRPEVVLLLLRLAERVVLVHAVEALHGEDGLLLRAGAGAAEAVEALLQHVDAGLRDLRLLEEALDLEVLQVEVPLGVDEHHQWLRLGPLRPRALRRRHARHWWRSRCGAPYYYDLLTRARI
mmetsp:Transcript_4904/g.14388  ORF Transcript_4904/g.14388 Transcript_4904/m.14388 type:complete len:401 (+) Transcript_4904:157-1359(+)